MSASTGAAVLFASFLVLILLLGIVLFVRIRQGMASRRERNEARARAEVWHAGQLNRPAMTPDEEESFRVWYASQGRAAALLKLSDAIEPGPRGSHAGGRVWMPDGEAWPTSKDGAPLQFLSQIDFAGMPALPEFPREGVLQFFIGPDDLYGANFDNPFDGAFRVLWRSGEAGDGALRDSPAAGEDHTPLSKGLRQESRRLEPSLSTMLPSPYGAEVGAHALSILDRPDADRIVAWMSEQATADREVHHVGGYPGMTQDDFRRDSSHAGLDRVLLQLWSEPDGAIMWGDVGQGSFTISQADLLARRFDRVAFHWDCT